MRFDPVEYDERARTIRWPGVDKGQGAGRCYSIAVTRFDTANQGHRWVAVRIPAHKYWRGLYQPWAYAPARIEVWELRKRNRRWEGREVMDITVRAKSQQ